MKYQNDNIQNIDFISPKSQFLLKSHHAVKENQLYGRD